MVSDWSNSAYTQCRRDRAAQAQVIVDHGQRIVALEAELADTKRHLELTEGSYNSDMRNAIAEHDRLQAKNRALRELQRTVTAFADEFDSDAYELEPLDKALWREVLTSLEPLAADHGLPLPGAGEGSDE